MDYHFGRVENFLKDIGEYDNTIVIFLSDNGPNPWYSEDYPGNLGSKWFAQFDNSIDNLGHPMSHYAYGMGWGSASAGPLDLFKMTVAEGGIRSPMLIAGPGVKGSRQVERMRGKSLQGVLAGSAKAVYGTEEFVGGEMQNGKWMRQGDFKAVSVAPPYGTGAWHLYNLADDPGETHDLADEQPERLKELQTAWDHYADEVGVVLTGQ
jgi:arylsulfatase